MKIPFKFFFWKFFPYVVLSGFSFVLNVSCLGVFLSYIACVLLFVRCVPLSCLYLQNRINFAEIYLLIFANYIIHLVIHYLMVRLSFYFNSMNIFAV